MKLLTPLTTQQLLLTEQQNLQVINVGYVAPIRSGYANYSCSSTTKDTNALINLLENLILIEQSVRD